MVDIIGARCLSCSHIVRVPASLGGRKAKCPKCNGIITIPCPGDSTVEFVNDADLPEVAKDDAPDVLEDGSPDPGDEDLSPPIDEEPEPEEEARVPARERHSSVRRHPPSSVRQAGRPTQKRRPAPGGANTNVVVGIVAGILVLIGVVGFVFLMKGDTPEKKKKDDGDSSTKPPPKANPEEDKVRARLREWESAWNSGGAKMCSVLGALYGSDDASHNRARDFFSDATFKEGLTFKAVRDITIKMGESSATTSFTCDRVTDKATDRDVKMTLTWQKYGEKWGISDPPAK